MHRFPLVIVALIAFSGSCFAQVPANAARDSASIATSSDSTAADGAFRMTKSPLDAVLLSAALPGAGQVYLHQAWKLPILYAFVAGFAYGVIIQNSRYHSAIDSVNSEMAKATGRDSLVAYSVAQGWANVREFYRNDRDKWWIYLGLTYVVNILDAYVSANLYDFDVSTPAGSDAPFQSYYDPIGGCVGISYTLHF